MIDLAVAPTEERATKWAKVIDHTRCIGCHARSTACKSENEVPRGRLRSTVVQPLRLALVAAHVGMLAVGSAGAQEPAPGVWTFVSSPHADLWFHGLAVVGFEGFAPMPLYNRNYAERVQEAKRERGVYPTPLDAVASRLRAGLEQDSTFELFHFVPLYFGLSSPSEMLDALQELARGEDPTDFGSGVVGSVMQSRRQRQLLGEFVEALEQEWQLFFRSYWAEEGRAPTGSLDAAQQLWDRELAPLLDPFLVERGAIGGVAFVSPAVGPEGRVFGGRPDRPDDNVAVLMSLAADSAAALFLVRELCFPLVSQLTEQLGIGAGDRVFAERMSSRAAVRCGALLLDRHAPRLAPAYRRLFVSMSSGASQQGNDAFARTFPADPALIAELRAVVGRD
jgi:hypothetical protein